MISTVTTVTTTVTTSSIIAGANAIMGVVAGLILVALLITRELSKASENSFSKRLSSVINVGAGPLIIIFVLIVAMKIMQLWFNI